jgi:hypothetical protein
MAIVSGGTVDIAQGTRITSHWKYGANIGGNIQFTGEVDRHIDRKSINSVLSLRSSVWLRYNRSPFEWESNLLLDEGLNLSETKFEDLITAPDDFRVISLFIYRFLSWMGPYGRTEMRTNLLPSRIALEESEKGFTVLAADSTIMRFDSSKSFQNKPSLCPFKLDVDLGANVDMVKLRFLELKVRGGAGSSFNNFPDRYEIRTNTSIIKGDSSSILQAKNSVILMPLKNTSTFEFGPQGSATGNLRIGRFATAGAELRVFAPIVPEMRFNRPDFDLTATLSWRLARALTLDYDYTYTLKQPQDVNARENYSTHKVYLRFSYTSR